MTSVIPLRSKMRTTVRRRQGVTTKCRGGFQTRPPIELPRTAGAGGFETRPYTNGRTSVTKRRICANWSCPVKRSTGVVMPMSSHSLSSAAHSSGDP